MPTLMLIGVVLQFAAEDWSKDVWEPDSISLTKAECEKSPTESQGERNRDTEARLNGSLF